MKAKRVLWAVNRPVGGPILIDSIVADIDEATESMSLNQRGREAIEEVLANNPQPAKAYAVLAVDMPHEVHRLIQMKHEAGVPVRAPLPLDMDSDTPIPSRYQELVDNVLLRIYSRASRSLASVAQHADAPIPMEQLRRSELGKTLARLAHAAENHGDSDVRAVLRASDRVLEALFLAAGEDHFRVPRAFWTEPLGDMFSRAALRASTADEWLTPTEAMESLQVSRSTLFRYIEDRALHVAREGETGRMYILTFDVLYLQEIVAQKSDVAMVASRDAAAS